MNILLAIQNFLVELFQTIASVIKILIGSGFFIKPEIRFDGKTCIILGNGPSLNQSIDEYQPILGNHKLLCVNHFAESPVYEKIKPEIYILNAPEMWMDDVEPFYHEKGKNLFNAISNNTNWGMDLFIPYSARKFQRWQEVINKNTQIRIFYFNSTPIEGYGWFRRLCYNNYLGMPRPHNVLIPSLMLSLYSKFGKIYLLGTDHSWMKDLWVTEDNEVLLNQKHFYDKNTSTAKPMDNLGKGSRKMHEVLQKFVYAFRGYIEINEYSRLKGQEIINCTKGSYIDAFKRSKQII
jgi:hypothetical protein